MKTLFVYVLLLSLFLPITSFADNDNADSQPIILQEVPETALKLSDDELRNLAALANETLEPDDETASKFRKFMAKLNFYQIGLNAERFNGMTQKNGEFANVAANVALLFMISHGIEMAGGLSVISYMATNSDFHPAVRSVASTIAFIIMLPGSDPLCYIVQAAYAKYPQPVSRLLHVPRTVLLKVLDLANGFYGVPSGAWSSFWYQVKLALFQARTGKTKLPVEETEKGFSVQVNAKDGRPIATLEIDRLNPVYMGLKSIEMKSDLSGEDAKTLKRASMLFGLNVHNWIRELTKTKLEEKQERVGNLPWVDRIDPIQNGFRITTKPEAFRMPNVCRAFRDKAPKLAAK